MKKIQHLLENKWVETAIILIMVAVVLLFLFTPNSASLKNLTTHAFEAVLIFLGSAMLFMVLQRPRIMFTSLGLCAVLCLFLKTKSNSGIQSFFGQNEKDISICQVVINSGSDEFDNISKRLLISKADVLNVQELTPEWSLVLEQALQSDYPYRAEIKRIDPYGMMVFSKYPIISNETQMYSDTARAFQIPVLKLKLAVDNDSIQFFSCHVLPRLNNLDFEKVQIFLDSVAQWVSKDSVTTMVIGDFNLTPWDFALQKLITDTRLNLSQREPHLFVQPFEHILYSSTMTCHKLEEVQTPAGLHLGIQGNYTFRAETEDNSPVKKY